MNTIGHEAIANQRHTVGFSILSQQIEIDHTIGVGVEDKSSPIPTLCDMVRYINGNNPRQAATPETLSESVPSVPGFPPGVAPRTLRTLPVLVIEVGERGPRPKGDLLAVPVDAAFGRGRAVGDHRPVEILRPA